MKIVRVSVGTPETMTFEGKSVQTSIFKSPVEGRVRVGRMNVEGDRQSDLAVHGGRDKAIYVYSDDYYDDWAREFDAAALQTSQFGENLTVSGCRDCEVVIGSRYRIGDAEVTVTQPRIPCYKLGIRLNDKTFPKTFWDRGRLGFYCRVESEGSIGAGDEIEMVYQPDHNVTVRELYEIVNGGNPDAANDAIEKLPHLDAGWLRRLRIVIRK